MNKKHPFYRGFTLIELMIVIVILGILMGTILPRLTGAQARARDVARQNDLLTISQALEAYFNDNGKYPNVEGCLSESSTAQASGLPNISIDPKVQAGKLGAYLKGGKMIIPRTKTLLSAGCLASYYYKPLLKNGIANTAYVLIADVETYQMANYTLTGTINGKPGLLSTLKYSDITLAQPNVPQNPATKTVFVVMP